MKKSGYGTLQSFSFSLKIRGNRMKTIEIKKLSKKYKIRTLHLEDTKMIYTFCKKNTQYYEYCGKELTIPFIEQDLVITPPNIPLDQKYYVGFFDGEKLVAVMDLIDGYPDQECAYIGFFMMNHDLQGEGVGSAIISDVLAYLREEGFEKCQLGIDRDNPQSNHFWRKNGFSVIREAGDILVAEKEL